LPIRNGPSYNPNRSLGTVYLEEDVNFVLKTFEIINHFDVISIVEIIKEEMR